MHYIIHLANYRSHNSPTDFSDEPKVITLAVNEFIRRFLLHVLPQGLHRIRHYGLFANGGRAENLVRARQLLDVPAPHDETDAEGDDRGEILKQPGPDCGGPMIVIETFEPGRALAALFKGGSSFSSLADKGLIDGTAQGYRLSATGRPLGEAYHRQRPDMYWYHYQRLYPAAHASAAHSRFCERVYGKDPAEDQLVLFISIITRVWKFSAQPVSFRAND